MIETIEIVNQVNYAAVPVVPIIAWIVSIGSGVGWVWWESNQEPQINTELVKQRGIVIALVVMLIILFFVFRIGREIIKK
jgi:hypothetical protein